MSATQSSTVSRSTGRGHPSRVLMILTVLSARSVLTAHPARAQFVTLLPKPMPDTAVATLQRRQVSFDSLRNLFEPQARSVCKDSAQGNVATRKQCERANDPRRMALASLANIIAATHGRSCVSRHLPADSLQSCIGAIDPMQEARSAGIRHWDTNLLFPHSRRQLAGLYGDGLRVFAGFTANVSDKEVLLLTDIVSGAVGVFPFGIAHAIVVSSADSQPNLSADTVRRATASVLQLLNNGGALSMRFQYPVVALGGANVKHSVSAYLQAGVLGPLGRPEQVQGSGAAVMEYMVGLAIRNPDTTAVLLGELVVGLRLGIATTLVGPIVPGVDEDRSFGFYQVGIGLQQSGALRLSVLINHVAAKASGRFVPDVILNLSALR